jgi:hypothetical protein
MIVLEIAGGIILAVFALWLAYWAWYWIYDFYLWKTDDERWVEHRYGRR